MKIPMYTTRKHFNMELVADLFNCVLYTTETGMINYNEIEEDAYQKEPSQWIAAKRVTITRIEKQPLRWNDECFVDCEVAFEGTNVYMLMHHIQILSNFSEDWYSYYPPEEFDLFQPY